MSTPASNLRFAMRAGAVLMFTGIVLGAFGAHALKEVLAPQGLAAWKTAVLYQLVHGVALLAIGEKVRNRWALRLLVIGVICFSGSIYVLTTAPVWAGVEVGFLGPITPLGGLAMLVGWGMILWQFFRRTLEK